MHISKQASRHCFCFFSFFFIWNHHYHHHHHHHHRRGREILTKPELIKYTRARRVAGLQETNQMSPVKKYVKHDLVTLRTSLEAELRTFCTFSRCLGQPERSELQQSNPDRTKADTSVFVKSTERSRRIVPSYSSRTQTGQRRTQAFS